MTHKDNTRYYKADDGKMIVRKSDGKVIGDSICIGDNDDISNYDEIIFSAEQRGQFFADIGCEDPKLKKPLHRNKFHDMHFPKIDISPEKIEKLKKMIEERKAGRKDSQK